MNRSAPTDELYRCGEFTCYKCGDYSDDCEDIDRETADKFVVKEDKSNYDCFNLGDYATFGAADCQFSLVDETASLALKCDRCRVSDLRAGFVR